MKGLVLKSSSPPEQKADTLPGQNEKDLAVRHCLLICCITLAIYIPLIHGNPWNGNEPTRVAVAQDMLRTGNWITPTLHGKLYLTKPPLMNWLIAASGAVFGVSGLVVADASVLPSSIGVNPQETIVAMALRNCERWLEARS